MLQKNIIHKNKKNKNIIHKNKKNKNKKNKNIFLFLLLVVYISLYFHTINLLCNYAMPPTGFLNSCCPLLFMNSP